MANPTAATIERLIPLWNDWQLRIITIMSMSLQIFLMVFASRILTTRSTWLLFYIRIAHILADWIAAYGVGLISSSQGSDSRYAVPDELLVFWSPFFLLHLVGAQTITSLSLDDFYLPIKHFVGLYSHLVAIFLILVKSFPRKLYIPTLMVFVIASSRNFVRIFYLLFRRFDVRDSRGKTPRFDHTNLLDTYSEMTKANMPIERLERPLPPKAKRLGGLLQGVPNIVEEQKQAILLYNTFKCFITKVTWSSKHRLISREIFRQRTPMEAFKLLELELYLMYEAEHSILRLFFFRFDVFLIVPILIASLVIFGRVEKLGWHKFDVVLTYILLSEALARASLSHCISAFLSKSIRRRKWSESVRHINLLAWCLRYHSKFVILVHKVVALFGLKDVIDIIKFRPIFSVHPITEDVKEIIFDELRMRSVVAENKELARKIWSQQRGDLALTRSFLYSQLKWSLGEHEYGEILILWHIATELCYNYKHSEFEGNCDEIEKRRTFCKILSDYMFYLLVWKHEMMVSVAGNWQTVFHDTFEHVKTLFLTRSVRNLSEACELMVSTYGIMPQRMPIGDGSKSVLVDASVLAKQLQGLKGDHQWKLMSQVWVELLTYAAFHCEANIHAQQPSLGGELLTFVWLLLNHLGLGKQVLEEDAPTEQYT